MYKKLNPVSISKMCTKLSSFHPKKCTKLDSVSTFDKKYMKMNEIWISHSHPGVQDRSQKSSFLDSCPGIISYRLSHRARSTSPLKSRSTTDRYTERPTKCGQYLFFKFWKYAKNQWFIYLPPFSLFNQHVIYSEILHSKTD
jgi:hypothetical protein